MKSITFKTKSLALFVTGILVMSGCSKKAEETPNQAPTISGVQVNPSSVTAGATAVLTVITTDPEDQQLTYTYLAAGGTISGSGSTATWTAPQQAGSYTVNVVVSDGALQAEGVGQLSVEAPTNRNPVISGVSVTIPNPVAPGAQLNYSVQASDPDGDALSYQFQVTAGSVSNNGPNAVWIAPNIAGAHSMTISVSDGRGGQATTNQSITVAEAETKITGIASFPAGASGDLANAKVSIYTSYDNWNSNSPLLYTAATGTGTQVNFSLNDIPAGVYYLDVWKDNDNNSLWSAGDFVGWYGSGGLGAPSLTQISIAEGQTIDVSIDMLIIQANKKAGNKKILK